MYNEYIGVITRSLRSDERLISSKETEMPFVIEAKYKTDPESLQTFLNVHSNKLLKDVAKYGAILLRGFDICADEDFEKTILSIKGLKGISEAFMSEEGRIPVGNLKYVLHTNAIYKTGGTLYLGGFHSENYYSPDVPSYICFCCLKPSLVGGETGLVNMEKVYRGLNDTLKEKLEKQSFLVSKWLISEVAERYHITTKKIEEICNQFDLPMVGQGEKKFILMYKPSIFEHPETKNKALQINLFELPTLNSFLRALFKRDYKGKTWFWHRLVWTLPTVMFSFLERLFLSAGLLIYSPKRSFAIIKNKLTLHRAAKKADLNALNIAKVKNCFTEKDVEKLAGLIRDYYCSCLWRKGDILIVDNRQVVHAGMPGAGPRLIRALICNPIAMRYSFSQPGSLLCQNRMGETIGFYMTSGSSNVQG